MSGVQTGANTVIMQPTNLYGCRLGDNCFVGPFVEIQRGVDIEDGVRISTHTFICEGVTIGAGSFIGHGVMFTNDKFKQGCGVRPAEYLKTVVGKGVSIGSGSTILPVNIGDGSVIGAGSVVTKDVPAGAVVCGNPARILNLKDMPH